MCKWLLNATVRTIKLLTKTTTIRVTTTITCTGCFHPPPDQDREQGAAPASERDDNQWWRLLQIATNWTYNAHQCPLTRLEPNSTMQCSENRRGPLRKVTKKDNYYDTAVTMKVASSFTLELFSFIHYITPTPVTPSFHLLWISVS